MDQNNYLVLDEKQEGNDLKEGLALFQPLRVAPINPAEFGDNRDRWLQMQEFFEALQTCLQRFNDGFGTIMLLDMAKS